MKGSGDDLDDDFIADAIVALSDDEGFDDAGSQSDDVHREQGSPDDAEPGPHDKANVEKKRKRREKLKERKAKSQKRRKLVEAVELIEESVANQPPDELASYLIAMQTKSFSDMSALELEDIRIPASSIADVTMWTGPRSLNDLVQFIMKALPSLHTRLSQKSKANGSPTLLFITGAALRVADVTRVLKDKRLRGEKGGEVAKLFAKHFKLAEHVTYLKRTKVGAAVGTPGRIGKLLCNTDALTVSALSHIILDVSFRDAKKRNLLDIPETRDEVFKTVLGCPAVVSAIRSGKIQVVLF